LIRVLGQSLLFKYNQLLVKKKNETSIKAAPQPGVLS